MYKRTNRIPRFKPQKDGTEEKWLVLSTIRYERGGKECMQFKSTSLIHGVIAPTGKYGC